MELKQYSSKDSVKYIKKAVWITDADPATFARTSTAYNADGTLVQANVPRFETDGVMVEEGTTNLILNPNFSNWTGELPANWTKDTISAVEKVQGIYAGTNAIKAANTTNGYLNASKATVSANTAYTVSAITKGGAGAVRFGILVEYYTSGNVFISNSYIATTELISTDWSKKQFQITTPATAAGVVIKFWIHTTVANNPAYIDYVQLEAKPYATSFHPTTRSPEVLTVPASALSATEGTIEFDVVFLLDTYANLGYRNIIDIGSTLSGGRIVLYIEPFDSTVRLQVGYSSTLYQTINTGIVPIKNVIYRCAISFKEKAKLYINRVLVATSTNKPSLNLTRDTTLGSSYTLADNTKANVCFSNIRFSSKERSDAELSYTGDLAVDEDTTYFVPLNSDLLATKCGETDASYLEHVNSAISSLEAEGNIITSIDTVVQNTLESGWRVQTMTKITYHKEI